MGLSRFLPLPTIRHPHQRLHRYPAGDGLLNNRWRYPRQLGYPGDISPVNTLGLGNVSER